MGLFDDAAEVIPDFSGGLIGGGLAIYAIIVLLSAVVLGIVIFYYYMTKKYNKKIVIFERINDRFEPTKKDKGAEIRLGIGGDTVLHLRKFKKYLPMPSLQTGRNTFWYIIRRDGEWINISMEDVDEKMELARVRFLSPEMRYARVGLEKSFRDRYNKVTFLQKYGGVIAFGGLIFLIGIMIWLMFDKMIDFMAQMGGLLNKIEPLMERSEQIMANMDKVCTGSGIKVA